MIFPTYSRIQVGLAVQSTGSTTWSMLEKPGQRENQKHAEHVGSLSIVVATGIARNTKLGIPVILLGRQKPAGPPRRFKNSPFLTVYMSHVLLCCTLQPKYTTAGLLFSHWKLSSGLIAAQLAECCPADSIDGFHGQLKKPWAIDASMHTPTLFQQALYRDCTGGY